MASRARSVIRSLTHSVSGSGRRARAGGCVVAGVVDPGVGNN